MASDQNRICNFTENLVRIDVQIQHPVVVHGKVVCTGEHCQLGLHGGVDGSGGYVETLLLHESDGLQPFLGYGSLDVDALPELAAKYVGFPEDSLGIFAENLDVEGPFISQQAADFLQMGIEVDIAFCLHDGRIGCET